MKNKTENKLRYLKFIFKITVSIILLIWIFYFIGVNKILIQLKNINIFFLLIAFIFVFFQIFFKALKWNSIIRMFKKRLDLYPSFVYTTISLAFGIVTPGRVGEFIKAKYLVNKTKIKYKESFITVILDKIFDVFAIFLLGLFGFMSLRDEIPYSGFFIFGFLLALIFLILLIFFFNVLPTYTKKLFPQKYRAWRNKTSFTKKLYTLTLAYSLVIWIVYVFEGFFILKALGLTNPSISGLMIVIALMALSSAVPVTFGGIGIREIVAIYFLLLLGIPTETAALFSIFYTVISFGTPGVIGTFYYLKEKDAFMKV